MKNCLQCNTEFKPRSCAHTFCSQKCRRAARGSNWRTIRNLILIRDKHTCQDCKAEGVKLEVHHLIALALGGDNQIENLLALCVCCHRKRHKTWRITANAHTRPNAQRAASRAKAA